MGAVAPHRVVDALEERIRPVEIEFRRAYWESQIDANDESEARRAELEFELRSIKGDGGALADVESALVHAHEPLLRRQLELLRLSMLGNQMDEEMRAELVTLETSVDGAFASFRPLIDGKPHGDNAIEEILKTSDDMSLRRQAWEASKEIGGLVAPRVREMARLRNIAARELGHPDFYQMSLELQEMSERWLFDLLDELDRLTSPPFDDWKAELDDALRHRFATSTLYPWHYSDPFFQNLPAAAKSNLDPLFEGKSAAHLAERTFALWGIDLSGVLEQSDLYPRARKSQHAFCLDVDRSGKDVRILANVVPGERWIEVMLHECGHAAYDVSIEPELPYFLRRAAHTFVTEAIAILSGRLPRHPEWLTGVAGVAGDEVAGMTESLRRAAAAQSLLFARWVLVVAHFERDLYADPEADLNQRWWELVERFQKVSPPPGRDEPDWAAKVHLASAPVYYHNYLLGELLASQLEAHCAREYGGVVGSADAGDFLVERIFRPGASLRWDEIIKGAVGGELSAEAFASHLS